MIAVNFTPPWRRFKARYMAVLPFVVLLFSMFTPACSAAGDAVSELDPALLSLPAADAAGLSSAGDAERIEALTSLIAMYSEQLEEYDRSGGNFVVGCIGIGGVILGLVVTFVTAEGRKNEIMRPNYGIALLFSLIPGIMTLCLYVFSMQCRRVEFFRGYLTYLEEKLSELLGIPMVFNSYVVHEFFGRFSTMQIGFVVMAVVVVMMFFVPLGCCFYFATPEKGSAGVWIKSEIVSLLFLAVFTVYGIACCIFVYDLYINRDIAAQVHQYCLGLYG